MHHIAISACSFRSSSSSSSSSAVLAVGKVSVTSAQYLERSPLLTWASRHRRCLVDLVVHRNRACIQHLVRELLLLKLLELFLQIFFVHCVLADALGNGLANFLADGMLFAEFFPREWRLVSVSEHFLKYPCISSDANFGL
jgi:hypothetical protein